MSTIAQIRRRAARGLAPALTVLAAAAALALPWQGARAYTVEDAQFVVSLGDGEGNERSVASDQVPYLPNQACFGWRIRLADSPQVVLVREVLKLPEAPAFWSGEDDAYSLHTFSADRTTATTVEYKVPVDGWIDSAAWCIAEGDPTGAHSIDVFIGDEHIRHFDFEVKNPAEFRNN